VIKLVKPKKERQKDWPNTHIHTHEDAHIPKKKVKRKKIKKQEGVEGGKKKRGGGEKEWKKEKGGEKKREKKGFRGLKEWGD